MTAIYRDDVIGLVYLWYDGHATPQAVVRVLDYHKIPLPFYDEIYLIFPGFLSPLHSNDVSFHDLREKI